MSSQQCRGLRDSPCLCGLVTVPSNTARVTITSTNACIRVVMSQAIFWQVSRAVWAATSKESHHQLVFLGPKPQASLSPTRPQTDKKPCLSALLTCERNQRLLPASRDLKPSPRLFFSSCLAMNANSRKGALGAQSAGPKGQLICVLGFNLL